MKLNTKQVQEFLTSWGLHFDTPTGDSTNIPYPQIYERMKEDAHYEGGKKLQRFISCNTDTTDGETYLTLTSWNEVAAAWNDFEKLADKPVKIEEDFHKFQTMVEKTTVALRILRKSQEAMRWQFDHPEWFEDFVNELKETEEGWVHSHC